MQYIDQEFPTKNKAMKAAIQYLKETLSNQNERTQRVNVHISLTRFLGAGRTKKDITWQLATIQTEGFENLSIS